MRAVLIGCGKIASEFADDPRIRGVYTHAESYVRCPDTRLVAVCDVDEARARRCAARWSVPDCFTDPQQMLERVRPDLVSVCSPDATHADLLELALAAPATRGVLAEKPLALDVPTAQKLVLQAEARGIALAVNYSRRYAASHQQLFAHVRGGGVGRIQNVTGWYTKGLYHNGTHWIDLLRWLVGDVQAVEAWPAADLEHEDATPSVRLILADGTSAVLHGCAAADFTIFEMDIVGSAGRLRILEGGQRLEVYGVADSPHATGYRALCPAKAGPGGLDDVTLHAVCDLVDAVKARRPPLCDGKSAVAALRIAAAAHQAAREHRRVEVPGS